MGILHGRALCPVVSCPFNGLRRSMDDLSRGLSCSTLRGTPIYRARRIFSGNELPLASLAIQRAVQPALPRKLDAVGHRGERGERLSLQREGVEVDRLERAVRHDPDRFGAAVSYARLDNSDEPSATMPPHHERGKHDGVGRFLARAVSLMDRLPMVPPLDAR
jgi:hypothetical protein